MVNTKYERIGLWEKDVVEMFTGPDLNKATRYGEYEVSPSNEWVDPICDLPNKDFEWDSGMESAVNNQPWATPAISSSLGPTPGSGRVDAHLFQIISFRDAAGHI